MSTPRIILAALVTIALATVTSCGEPAQDTSTGADLDNTSSVPVESDPPGTTTPTTTGSSADPDDPPSAEEGDLARLIATAAERRVTIDNSFQDAAPFDRIVVVDQLRPEWNEEGEPTGDLQPTPASPAAREAVTEALDPIETTWMGEDEVDTLIEELYTTGWDENVVILRISRPTITGDTAQILTSIECGPTCGLSKTDEFLRGEDGSWSYVRSIGPTLVF